MDILLHKILFCIFSVDITVHIWSGR